MGVYIKGIEMPKCGRITIQIGADGAVYLVTDGKITAEIYMECNPAITVPPHGRLVDADKLTKEMRLFIKENMLSRDDARELLETIEDAPAVIEAEEAVQDARDGP